MVKRRVYYYDKNNLLVMAGLARYKFALIYLKNKIVADIGCGARRGPQLMAEYAAKVIGLDISREAISYSAKAFPAGNLFYAISDATNIALKDGIFDVVLSFEVIEHIDNYTAYLKEVFRVLKDNGVFLISTPNRPVASPSGIFSNPDHIREFDLDEFLGVLNKVFLNVEIFGQFPSERIKQIESIRQKNLSFLSRIPLFVKRIFPAKLKEFILVIYHRHKINISIGIDDRCISEDDFLINKENVNSARYFLAMCRKL